MITHLLIPIGVTIMVERVAERRLPTLGMEQVPRDYLGRITANITIPTMFSERPFGISEVLWRRV